MSTAMGAITELSPMDRQWDNVLRRHPHDCYHTDDYLSLMAAHEPGTTVKGLLYGNATAEVFLPILVRPLPSALGGHIEGSDCLVPYGYGGPVGSAIADSETFRDWLSALTQWALDRKIVSCFVRWHPLLHTPDHLKCAQLRIRGTTVAVDLATFSGVLDDVPRPSHRTEIRWLLRNNYSVVWDGWEYFEDFRRLYAATMVRLSAKATYRYSGEYFHEMRRRLGSMLHLGVVLSPAKTVAAAALFTECSGIVQYSLSASDEGLRKKSPTKLLIAAARAWAKSRGNKWLHLGGGLGSQRDDLFQFKAGFSDFIMPFATSEFVFDPHKYDAMVLKAEAVAGALASASYFPTYRSLLETAAR